MHQRKKLSRPTAHVAAMAPLIREGSLNWWSSHSQDLTKKLSIKDLSTYSTVRPVILSDARHLSLSLRRRYSTEVHYCTTVNEEKGAPHVIRNPHLITSVTSQPPKSLDIIEHPFRKTRYRGPENMSFL
jgi:hypothetical protein